MLIGNKVKSKVILTQSQISNIKEDDSILNAAILYNNLTGNEFLVCDEVLFNPTVQKNETVKRIRHKLNEQRIEVFEDPKTGEVERISTSVYSLVKQIKGNVLIKTAAEKSIEERVMDELGMSLEDAKAILQNENGPSSEEEIDEDLTEEEKERKALEEEAKKLSVKGVLSNMRTETLQTKIAEAISKIAEVESLENKITGE